MLSGMIENGLCVITKLQGQIHHMHFTTKNIAINSQLKQNHCHEFFFLLSILQNHSSDENVSIVRI